MFKREFRRKKDRFIKFFDPIGVFALLLLLILPIMTVLNLTPKTSAVQKTESVLGASYKPNTTGAELVAGFHSVIVREIINKEGFLTTYNSAILPREAGHYSKPIIRLYNTTNSPITYKLSTTSENIGTTELTLNHSNSKYVIHSSNGEFFVRSIKVAPGQDVLIYLEITDNADVNYETEIKINILQEDPLRLD